MKSFSLRPERRRSTGAPQGALAVILTFMKYPLKFDIIIKLKAVPPPWPVSLSHNNSSCAKPS